MRRLALALPGVAALALAAATWARRGETPPPVPSFAPARAQDDGDVATAPTLTTAQWNAIGGSARRLAAAESPATAFPFAPAAPREGRARVVAHYFPAYPIALGKQPADADYYARNYLRGDGEGGKWRHVGGLLRDRPLPLPIPVAANARQRGLALDVARAARIGVDAFGVDLLGLTGRSWRIATDLLDAAHAVSPAFRIVPEPDMAALKDIDVKRLADALGAFWRHSAGYRLTDGRLLVMPFLAERQPPAFWQALLTEMAHRRQPIAFAPVYLSPGAIAANAPISYAASIWGDRDPNAARRATTAAATAAAAGVTRWIAPVAPQDYRPKNGTYWEARNADAYLGQWRAAIDGRAPLIHLTTWNDYSESTHLAPSAFTQFVFYDLAAYHIAWAKGGVAPAVTRDALYYVQRRQIFGAGGETRRGGTPLSNDVEIVALLRAPARLALTAGGNRVVRDVGAGLHTLRVPAAPGRPSFAVLRGGKAVIEGASAWPIAAAPGRGDATYGGGSSTRALVETPGFAEAE